jgi:tRNA modification GTPase
VTGRGLVELKEAIVAALDANEQESGVIAGTAERCRDSLRLASEALYRSRAAAERGKGEELVAAELRIALDELGRVVGAVYTEDILDRVFSRFCIGK